MGFLNVYGTISLLLGILLFATFELIERAAIFRVGFCNFFVVVVLLGVCFVGVLFANVVLGVVGLNGRLTFFAETVCNFFVVDVTVRLVNLNGFPLDADGAMATFGVAAVVVVEVVVEVVVVVVIVVDVAFVV